jgi:hypothetical protein
MSDGSESKRTEEGRGMNGTDITESPADKIRRFAGVIEEVQILHKPFRIYEECSHEHDDADIVNCGDFVSCEAGYMYSICTECCTSEAYGIRQQTEECADVHRHDDGEPRCRTFAVLMESLCRPLDEPVAEVTTSA